ncbi:hypothetical protein IJD44_06685 [bacterium]|nr:hypothetical protein [bacterium]
MKKILITLCLMTFFVNTANAELVLSDMIRLAKYAQNQEEAKIKAEKALEKSMDEVKLQDASTEPAIEKIEIKKLIKEQQLTEQ